MAKQKVSDRGHVEIDGHDYAPGATIPDKVKVPKWLVDQGYVNAPRDVA